MTLLESSTKHATLCLHSVCFVTEQLIMAGANAAQRVDIADDQHVRCADAHVQKTSHMC